MRTFHPYYRTIFDSEKPHIGGLWFSVFDCLVACGQGDAMCHHTFAVVWGGEEQDESVFNVIRVMHAVGVLPKFTVLGVFGDALLLDSNPGKLQDARVAQRVQSIVEMADCSLTTARALPLAQWPVHMDEELFADAMEVAARLYQFGLT